MRPKESLAEWIVAGLGLLLVVSSLVFVVYEAATRDNGPPDIAVRVDTIVATGAGYVVELKAHNSGDRTAALVSIRGLLISGADTVEQRETTIEYLPPGSNRGGGLIFSADPRAQRLVISAIAYRDP